MACEKPVPFVQKILFQTPWHVSFYYHHSISAAPFTLSDGGLQRHHLANDDAVNWLERTAMKARTK